MNKPCSTRHILSVPKLSDCFVIKKNKKLYQKLKIPLLLTYHRKILPPSCSRRVHLTDGKALTEETHNKVETQWCSLASMNQRIACVIKCISSKAVISILC